MESPGKKGGMILSQIKTPFAVGAVCVKVGTLSGVLSGRRYFYKQVMIVCKFHLILRRAGSLAVTTKPCGWQSLYGRQAKLMQPARRHQYNIRKEKHEGYLE
ncbi:hypothetical protein [Polaromonas glacialis]|uniref:hypothetical protein n=1 Tax=Polaromonas glacialis TaxID=866564 RepID=UPI0012ECAA51|nr:hypothetical protein [Polaromonas glacialis]